MNAPLNTETLTWATVALTMIARIIAVMRRSPPAGLPQTMIVVQDSPGTVVIIDRRG